MAGRPAKSNVSMPKAKVSKLDQQESDEQQQALDKVAEIQSVIDDLNEQASEEILKVEQKYNQARKPHFQERADVIKKIPEFWATTLLSHPNISELIDTEDEAALQYMTELLVEEYDDVKSGYKITFYFCDNPYFENGKISKEFSIDDKGEPKSTGTEISWKPRMNLVSRQPAAMQGRKRSHDEPISFFSWFNDNMIATSDEVAEIIKDDIWNNPLQYYLAVTDIGDNYDEEADEEDEALEDGDEDEDEPVLGDEEDYEGEEDDDQDEQDN